MNGCPSLRAQFPGPSRLLHLTGWKAGLAAGVNPRSAMEGRQSMQTRQCSVLCYVCVCLYMWHISTPNDMYNSVCMFVQALTVLTGVCLCPSLIVYLLQGSMLTVGALTVETQCKSSGSQPRQGWRVRRLKDRLKTDHQCADEFFLPLVKVHGFFLFHFFKKI